MTGPHKPTFTQYLASVTDRGITISDPVTAEVDFAAGYGAGHADGFAAGYAAALGTGT